MGGELWERFGGLCACRSSIMHPRVQFSGCQKFPFHRDSVSFDDSSAVRFPPSRFLGKVSGLSEGFCHTCRCERQNISAVVHLSVRQCDEVAEKPSPRGSPFFRPLLGSGTISPSTPLSWTLGLETDPEPGAQSFPAKESAP